MVGRITLMVLLLVWACVAQTPLKTVRVASGLTAPLYAGAPPGDFERLFIAEHRTGRIRILRSNALLATPFLDIGSKLTTGNEQ